MCGSVPEISEFDSSIRLKKDEYYLWEGDLIELVHSYLEKEPDTSVMLFEYCADLFPNSIDSQDWLGSVYFDCGMNEKAIQTFNTCLEMNPLDSYAAGMLFQLKN
jgi:tetratricopeptide (TPR) repeat protein